MGVVISMNVYNNTTTCHHFTAHIILYNVWRVECSWIKASAPSIVKIDGLYGHGLLPTRFEFT